MLFGGLDVSTQSTKLLLVDVERGSVRHQDAVVYDDDLPRYRTRDGARSDAEAGVSESDPRMWIDAVSMLFERMARSDVDVSSIRAISVSGQQHGLVCLDAAGELARPMAKLWNDVSTAGECELLHQRAGGPQAMIAAVGNVQRPGYTASKIMHFVNNEPESYSQTATCFLVHNYVNWFLTGGEIVMEPGDTSGMALWHPERRTWADDVVNAIDPELRNKLPPVRESDEFIGVIDVELAERYGFDKRVLIGAGSGDNMYAAIGTGNVRPGVVTVSLGTSGTAYSYSEEAWIDPDGEIAAFCDSTGHHLPLVCVSNLANGYNALRRVHDLSHREFEKIFEQSPPANGGRVVVPWFVGERTPDLPLATPVLFGFGLEDLQPSSPGALPALCRGVVEGHVLNLFEGFSKLPVEPVEVRLTGGLASSTSWCQAVADLFEVEAVPVQGETAALGAAIHAAWVWNRKESQDAADAMDSLRSLTDRLVVLDEPRRASPRASSADDYRDLKALYRSVTRRLRGLGDDADPFEIRRRLS